MFRRRSGENGGGDSSPALVHDDLRAMALALESGILPQPPVDHPGVSGVVVDIPSSEGFATLVALTDDTTSFYAGAGGATTVAGKHTTVAAATHDLLTAVQHHLDSITDLDDPSLPPVGTVRFHVLATDGQRHVDVPEDAFRGRVDHPLMPVITATHAVISTMPNAGLASA